MIHFLLFGTIFLPLLTVFFLMFLYYIGNTSKKLAAIIITSSSFTSFLSSIFLWFSVKNQLPYTLSFPWISIENWRFGFGFHLDQTSCLLLGTVSFVSLLVLNYALSYMAKDEGFYRYFIFMFLFIFSMLSLLVSSELIQFFIFWELMGACSFFLIGFWFKKPRNIEAAFKAFLITKIGDAGLLLGIIVCLSFAKTNQIMEIAQNINAHNLSTSLITVLSILFLTSAIGKSAQFPLQIWLPDAMAGPIPTSALLHAATMVSAGIYLIYRLFPLFILSPLVFEIITLIAVITVLIAGFSAIAQNNLKRILAFSTISQLGFMLLAIGQKNPDAALFHLTTHAFFKALLFLSAGVIIRETQNQDIREISGILHKIPTAALGILIGGLALIGIPPLAGFWSKEEILDLFFKKNNIGLFLITLLATGLTAIYTTRIFLILFKNPKTADFVRKPLKPFSVALISLMLSTFLAGFLRPLIIHSPLHFELFSIGFSFLTIFAGTGIVLVFCLKRLSLEDYFSVRFGFLYSLFENQFYTERILFKVFGKIPSALSKKMQQWEKKIIDGLIHKIVEKFLGLSKKWKQIDLNLIDSFFSTITTKFALAWSKKNAVFEQNWIEGIIGRISQTLQFFSWKSIHTQTGQFQYYGIWIWLSLLLLIFVSYFIIRFPIIQLNLWLFLNQK